MVRNLPRDFAASKSEAVAVSAPLLLSDAATWTITKNGEGGGYTEERFQE